MALDADDEILQDFLVEAGEILELLGEQLVELEQSSQDSELLNAVFRGFHTIKGGAGFLAIKPMVDICHCAEDVFNLLRQGERELNPDMMDKFLRVLDILNDQFTQVGAGEDPTVAEPELLAGLQAIISGENAPAPAATAAAPAAVEESESKEAADAPEGDITDDEFEALLETMEKGKGAAGKGEETKAAASEEISDDEFESMLDDIHGKGAHSSPAASKDTTPVETAAPEAPVTGDEISEDEFDTLLDELHGKGKSPTEEAVAKKPAKEPAKKAKADKPVEKPKVVKQASTDETKEKPAEPKKDAPKAAARTTEATVRVDTKRLDDIMNMVGELVLVRNRLDTLKEAIGDEEVSKAVSNLDIVTSDLQSAVMKTRMQPVKKVFGRFPRVVRDLARSLNKEVDLELIGEETDLDKNLVEALADPLVHLVRNSVDHGIEMPDVREKNGKPRAGKVELAASQAGDHILLTITDGGAGMDPDLLRGIAVDKGVMDAESAARLDDKECYNLIFAPGFSTKAEISDISGRGVGMDVVKTRIAQLNGSIDIDSTKGIGTKLSVQLPLTLAILPTLMVKVGKRNFALPLSSVHEIFHMDDTRKNIVDGQVCVMVREKAMPLYYLREWLAKRPQDVSDEPEVEQVVVTHVGNQRVGFVVSQVVGQEEVVIKPLGAMLHGLPGFAGATITGDGRIALIMDVPSLMKAYANRG